MRRVISAIQNLLRTIVRRPAAAAAAAALALVAVLQVIAIHRQSLTYDAPYHLLAGYQALYYGENLVNYEHPPLVKMAAALPLLAEPIARSSSPSEEPLVELTPVTAAYPAAQFVFEDPARERRIRLASRYTLLLLVVFPLLAASWALGRRLAGPGTPPRRAGLVLTLMLGLSFATLPHLPTLQTDAALALATVLTLLSALAYLRRPDPRRVALLGLALGLALSVKLSGLLLLPTSVAALALAPRVPLTRRLLHLALVLLTALALLQLTYLPANRHYDPTRGQAALHAYADNRATLHVGDRLELHLPTLLALGRFSPGLAQHLTGLLGVRAQNAEGVYNTYAFGQATARGRWWYFPAVFALKTPLPILFALLAALLFYLRGRRSSSGIGRGTAEEPSAGAPRQPRAETDPIRRRALFLAALTAAVYLATALTSSYNLGIRHLLPVLPLLYLPAALWTARTSLRTAAITLFLATEALLLTPRWMSATNTWWLGEHNPTRFALGDTNLEYHQSFLILAAELERRGISAVGIAMPAITAAELACYLPNARPIAPGAPLPPGWYASSATVEQMAPALLAADPEDLFRPEVFQPAARDWITLAARLAAAGEDHGYAAGTFRLYRVPPALDPG